MVGAKASAGGRVVLGAGCIVHPTARLEAGPGQLTLGAGCHIGARARLIAGPGLTLGADSSFVEADAQIGGPEARHGSAGLPDRVAQSNRRRQHSGRYLRHDTPQRDHRHPPRRSLATAAIGDWIGIIRRRTVSKAYPQEKPCTGGMATRVSAAICSLTRKYLYIRIMAPVPGITVRQICRALFVMLCCAGLSACSFPRGAALNSEILKEQNAENPDFQVVAVTQSTVSAVNGRPRASGTSSAGWVGKRGPDSQIIRSNDRVSVTIWDNEPNSLLTPAGRNPSRSREIAVSPSGTIFLPYVENVVIRGLTPDEARSTLQTSMPALRRRRRCRSACSPDRAMRWMWSRA